MDSTSKWGLPAWAWPLLLGRPREALDLRACSRVRIHIRLHTSLQPINRPGLPIFFGSNLLDLRLPCTYLEAIVTDRSPCHRSNGSHSQLHAGC
jgi:hypothetical protein